jgi:plasmid stabilization system protein ParE
MTFRVVLTDHAQRDLDDLARHCRRYSADLWDAQEARLAQVFDWWLATMPHTWSFFFATGAPYRAYLFQLGARTKYWIVYSIDEAARVVNVLRVWNAAQDPSEFRL